MYINHRSNGPLPATISKHEEEHTEDDAGHADVDANHDATQRALSVSARAQGFPFCW